MSESDSGQRDFEAIREHLYTALLSAHEQYDKAVLTLSTGLLGLSVTFIKSDSGTAAVRLRCLLVLSWIFLLIAIFSTLISFIFSQRALTKALDDAYDLYIRKRSEALRANLWRQATAVLNLSSGVFFFLGAVLTVVFVAVQGG